MGPLINPNIISAYTATSGAGQGTYGYTDLLQTTSLFAGTNYMISASEAEDIQVTSSALISQEEKGFGTSGTDSIFNKFTTFAYAGLYSGFTYQEGGHFVAFYNQMHQDVTGSLANDIDKQSAANKLNILDRLDSDRTTSLTVTNLTEDQRKARISAIDSQIKEVKGKNSADANRFGKQISQIRSNPTATQLIDWGSRVSPSSVQGFSPYSYTDFVFCKNYGRIPNNRLITLRRYPFPVQDSVRLAENRSKSAIPVAQAVTWLGGDTGNSLSAIPFFSWDMPWDTLQVGTDGPTGQIIEGNEILATDVLQAISGITGKDSSKALAALFATVKGDNEAIKQISGYDKIIQDYQRNLYTTGPYWNRIYGPVNVITATSHRTRGIQTSNWKAQFKLNFHYSFRSFNGMSPKIVALDLISNFLNLTYNDAQFLGQLNRYFTKNGLKFSSTMEEAIAKLVTDIGTTFNGDTSGDLLKVVEQLGIAAKSSTANLLANPLGVIKESIKAGAQVITAQNIKDAIPKLLSIKSALADRPVGEWHITVGNPMNPIFVAGDLIVTDTVMKFDEEFGPDDFPTGVTFTVTLQQGKPRDKTAIERMLNLGDTKLTSGTIKTSAYDDTFGTENNKTYDEQVIGQPSEKSVDKVNGASSKFQRYKSRFNSAYGDPKSGGLDDTVLQYYYSRRYENN